MAKIGILTFSDGRDFVHEDAGVGKFPRNVEDNVLGALEGAGHEVVRAREVIWTNRLAVIARRRSGVRIPSAPLQNVRILLVKLGDKLRVSVNFQPLVHQ